MDVQYALYDALASINVPPDKARAVVPSMESDMIDTLATKADLAATRTELHATRDLLRQEDVPLVGSAVHRAEAHLRRARSCYASSS
ncbi:MAG: hypothetical protein QM718_07880 [Steroidobacteraceae bacterium]